MSKLYYHTEEIHNLNAPREIVPQIMSLLKPTSVLDVGCGTATWLKAFEEQGVTDYIGVDGEHLDRSLLQIPQEKFQVRDLRQEFGLQRKFDLVLSLEVAEHLDEQVADQHVKTLTEHGSAILFSAAVPHQGGQNHVNEQWPDYWQKKFERHGFYFHDVIRPVVWNNDRVDWWYRQNVFLLRKERPENPLNMASVIHPVLFNRVVQVQQQYVVSLLSGRQGIAISVKIFLNAVRFKIQSLFGRK